MSVRRSKSCAIADAAKLRTDLAELKAATVSISVDEVPNAHVSSSDFDKLTSTEKSAASLGIQPSSWKPISFLNNAHYDALVKANMLDDTLARRIEAYRAVATASQ